ncbi:MAG: ribonuclease P protein subunit [Promethearchaeota archaeon]
MNKIMLSPRYIIYHDLIGFHLLAKSKSKPKSKAKAKILEFKDIGIVTDESRNMIITKKKNKIKKYIKKDYIFRVIVPNSKKYGNELVLEVDGDKIVGLPENRLRSLRKKRRI